MRSTLAIALTAALFGCVSSAPMLDEATQKAITAQVEASTDSIFAAASTLQIDSLLSFWTADQLDADQGRLVTLEEARSTYRDIYATLASLSFTRERTVVQVLGPDVAVAVTEGSFQATPKQGDPFGSHAAWTYVWRRNNGAWRVIHDHQSLVTPPPRQ